MINDNLEEKIVTLIGFVYEVGGKEQVTISTGYEDYFVEMNEMGEELFKEIENDVKLTGIVTKDQDGK